MFASRAVLILSLCIFAGAQTYQQVWSDEFTGNSLDTSKWQYEVNCDGGGNNELQCYTSNANNLAVSNGVLSITAVPQYLNGKQYTSARINTRASAAWKYGKIEFRAKVPSGQYLWPALWMMPRDNVYGAWAASGEIDIMENRGNTNQQESTLHYGGGWPNNVYQGSGPTYMPFNMTSDFHLYAAIWTPTKIDFLVDNNVYYTQTLQKSFWSGQGSNPYTANGQPFDQYFYIIINLAVGGGFFGGNSQALTVQQAQAWTNPTLSVDYVRVYQLSSSPVNVNPAPAPQSNPTTSSAASTSAAAASTSYTPVATGGGCPAGTCGSNGCCNDQRNGIQCYDVSIYSCPVDGFTSKYGLCQKGYAICSGACYNPAAYQCNNGALGPVSATPKTSAAATPSTTRAATSTTQQTTSAAQAQTTRASTSQAATPATNSACPNGCGTTGQCCNDARSGGLCYLASAHTCVQDTNGKFYLCGPNAGVCGGNCFDALSYKCVNGILGQL